MLPYRPLTSLFCPLPSSPNTPSILPSIFNCAVLVYCVLVNKIYDVIFKAHLFWFCLASVASSAGRWLTVTWLARPVTSAIKNNQNISHLVSVSSAVNLHSLTFIIYDKNKQQIFINIPIIISNYLWQLVLGIQSINIFFLLPR